MSTFGREADRLAKQRREHERLIAKKANQFRRAISFAVNTLNDKDIADDVARKMAIEALVPWTPQ